jgi:hypothetical protein
MHSLLKPLLAFALVAALVGAGLANAEVFRKGNLQLNLSGKLSPSKLPRKGTSPIGVTVGGDISTTDKTRPPKLRSLQIELNRNGDLEYEGLPVCNYDLIQPASSSRALSACRSSLVGQGSFNAEITLTGQDPYKTKGKLLAFNGKEKGKPVLFGQIYSPRPFATSFVIVFQINRDQKGTYGTALTADLPESLKTWGNLTGIELTLNRKYSFKGKKHSYLSAGCPTPKGVAIASFDFAKTSFGFEGGKVLSGALKRTCKAR